MDITAIAYFAYFAYIATTIANLVAAIWFVRMARRHLAISRIYESILAQTMLNRVGTPIAATARLLGDLHIEAKNTPETVRISVGFARE